MFNQLTGVSGVIKPPVIEDPIDNINIIKGLTIKNFTLVTHMRLVELREEKELRYRVESFRGPKIIIEPWQDRTAAEKRWEYIKSVLITQGWTLEETRGLQ